MSRVAKAPIPVPKGVEFKVDGGEIRVKGPKGALALPLHPDVDLVEDNGEISVRSQSGEPTALTGTYRSLVNNLVVGVTDGFEKKLNLVGVGYRAQVQGTTLSLSLGFSHPVEYKAPDGITIEAPSQTEVVVKGCDKQRVGQVAAEIRAFRPPEPYKGKGVRYSDEQVVRKEAKKA